MAAENSYWAPEDAKATIPFGLTGRDMTGAPDGDNEGPDAAAAGVPKVWPDGSARDVNFASIAPKQHSPAMGHDTYQGIPGDGIVGGNPGSDHNTPISWGLKKTNVKGSGPGGNTPAPGGGGGAE